MTTHFDGCECWYCHHGVHPPGLPNPNPLTYKGHPLSYWYAEYQGTCYDKGTTPLVLVEWVRDPAHSPQFRAAFGLTGALHE